MRGRRGTIKQRLPRTAPQRIYGRIVLAAGNSLPKPGWCAGQMRNYNRRRKDMKRTLLALLILVTALAACGRDGLEQ